MELVKEEISWVKDERGKRSGVKRRKSKIIARSFREYNADYNKQSCDVIPSKILT